MGRECCNDVSFMLTQFCLKKGNWEKWLLLVRVCLKGARKPKDSGRIKNSFIDVFGNKKKDPINKPSLFFSTDDTFRY